MNRDRRRHRARRAGRILLACAGLACGGDREDERFPKTQQALDSVLATLAAGTDGLQVKRRELAFWEPAGVGTSFMAGDWVQSGPGAFARIELLPGGRLDVDASAIVVVDAQSIPHPGGPPTAEALLAVETGVIRGVLRQPGQTVGIRAADGTTARLSAQEGGGAVEYRLAKRPRGTEVAIQKGAAVLAGKDRSHELRAGQAVDVAEETLGAVVQLIGAPELSAPRMDATLRVAAGTPTTLQWRAVPQAAGYRVQLSAREDFLQVTESFDSDTPSLSWTPPREGPVFWRIAARDAEGRFGLFGAARRFVVARPAEADLLRAPAANALFTAPRGQAVTFAWEEVPEGGYRLVVARGKSLEGEAVVDEVTLTPHATVKLGPGSYTWGVYAIVNEDSARPLFIEPRSLTIEGSSELKIRVPRQIKEWGR